MRKEGSRDSCDSMAVASQNCMGPPLRTGVPWCQERGCLRFPTTSSPGHQTDCGRCGVTCCLAFLVSLGKLVCSRLFGSVANVITLTD